MLRLHLHGFKACQADWPAPGQAAKPNHFNCTVLPGGGHHRRMVPSTSRLADGTSGQGQTSCTLGLDGSRKNEIAAPG